MLVVATHGVARASGAVGAVENARGGRGGVQA